MITSLGCPPTKTRLQAERQRAGSQESVPDELVVRRASCAASCDRTILSS
jgi:hypothetical protein